MKTEAGDGTGQHAIFSIDMFLEVTHLSVPMLFQGIASGYKYSMLNLKGWKQALLFERQMQKEQIK